MSKVFVLDAKKRPLTPCHPARARQLLRKGKAAIYRRYPFTLLLKREVPSLSCALDSSIAFTDRVCFVPCTHNSLNSNSALTSTTHKQTSTRHTNGGAGVGTEVDSQLFRLKIDPGSKTTGMAILNDSTGEVVWSAELQHRGQQIKNSLSSRRAIRRSRRNRKTRYRKPRFNNRNRPKGKATKNHWLPPSVRSRVYNIETWVLRLRKLCPITAMSLELVKFDTQAMQNPEISGVEYQQGELLGYEVREYLLEKFSRRCVYCGKENIPDLEVEHIIPKTRGGSNRVSNLTIACKKCNLKKGNQTAEEFGYPFVQEQAKKPLKDAAAINATRWEILRRLQVTGLPIEVGTGGRTKFNRIKKGLPKTHWIDAVCVGASTPEIINIEGIHPLSIIATGRGSRQMCRVDKFGFPRTTTKHFKRIHGFQTGDMVKVVVPKGKKVGTYVGRVAIRTSGSFNLKTPNSTIQGISHQYCYLLQHADGYNYEKKRGTALPPAL